MGENTGEPAARGEHCLEAGIADHTPLILTCAHTIGGGIRVSITALAQRGGR
jgi:hypothetical protein